MPYSSHGRFRQQMRFLRRQFGQDGNLPFSRLCVQPPHRSLRVAIRRCRRRARPRTRGCWEQGPFGEATEIAGQQIAIPLLSGKEGGKEEVTSGVTVTQPAKWDESPVPNVDASRLTEEVKTAEPSVLAKLAAPVIASGMAPATSSPVAPVVPSAPSVESVGTGGFEHKATTLPSKPSGGISAEPHLEPIRLTGYKSVPGP
jgi:hypothetical protein